MTLYKYTNYEQNLCLEDLDDRCLCLIASFTLKPWLFRVNCRMRELLYSEQQEPIFRFLKHKYWKKHLLLDPENLFPGFYKDHVLALHLRPYEIPLLINRLPADILRSEYVSVYLNMSIEFSEEDPEYRYYASCIADLIGRANVSMIVYSYESWSKLVYPRYSHLVRLFAERSFIGCEMPLDFRNCTSLEIIGNYAFSNLRRTPDFTQCTRLKLIRERAFYALEEPPDLSNCKELMIIENSAFHSLKRPPLMHGCKRLEKIDNAAFFNLTAPPDLRSCSRLKEIGPYAFFNLKTQPPDLTQCTSLETIGPYAFFNLEEPPDLTKCKNLKRIGKQAFYNLKKMPDLSQCLKLFMVDEDAFPPHLK